MLKLSSQNSCATIEELVSLKAAQVDLSIVLFVGRCGWGLATIETRHRSMDATSHGGADILG